MGTLRSLNGSLGKQQRHNIEHWNQGTLLWQNLFCGKLRLLFYCNCFPLYKFQNCKKAFCCVSSFTNHIYVASLNVFSSVSPSNTLGRHARRFLNGRNWGNWGQFQPQHPTWRFLLLLPSRCHETALCLRFQQVKKPGLLPSVKFLFNKGMLRRRGVSSSME